MVNVVLPASVSTNQSFEAASSSTLENLQNIQIGWLASGKPVVDKPKGSMVEVSLSHDEQFCLCVAGEGPQGCDIAPVTQRSQEDWIALLGSVRKSVIQQLLTANDSLDRAGTRIWAAIEALRKATDAKEIDLTLDLQQDDCILFRGTINQKSLYVQTFPILLSRGPERIFAVVVQKEAA